MAAIGIETCARLNIALSQSQRRAIQYLERAQQVFAVHFGYANAVDKAREHWLGRRRSLHARHRFRL